MFLKEGFKRAIEKTCQTLVLRMKRKSYQRGDSMPKIAFLYFPNLAVFNGQHEYF